MTRDEAVRERTVKRFLECEARRAEARAAALAEGKSEDEAREIAHEAAKRYWNAWAADIRAKRKALDEFGVGSAGQDGFGNIEPKNTEMHTWMEEAEADFSRCLFLKKGEEKTQAPPEDDKNEVEASLTAKSIEVEVADFRGFAFPYHASFNGASFSSSALFDRTAFSGNVSFDSTSFSNTASFSGTSFLSTAWFRNTTFTSSALFGNAAFSGNTWFESASFSGQAWFANATFSNIAWFKSATFSGTATFDSATVSDNASFDSATFRDARFDSATFSGFAQFGSATFSGDAWFANATFLSFASFDSATFSGDATFGSSTFLKSTWFREAVFGFDEKNTKADFSAIKVERAFDLTEARFSKIPSFCLADFKQAPDLDRVSFPLPSAEPFVIGDPSLIPKYRALRRMAIQGADYESEHKAFKGELRSRRWGIDKWWHPSAWLGVLYDGIADCGRSITQPAIAWAATIIAFAAFYWGRAFAGAEARCADGGGAFVQALYFSVKNGLVLFAGTRDARVNQAYACLYTGTAEQPHIPPSVTFVETLLHFPISAVLIFLGLLAVRNRFKIK